MPVGKKEMGSTHARVEAGCVAHESELQRDGDDRKEGEDANHRVPRHLVAMVRVDHEHNEQGGREALLAGRHGVAVRHVHAELLLLDVFQEGAHLRVLFDEHSCTLRRWREGTEQRVRPGREVRQGAHAMQLCAASLCVAARFAVAVCAAAALLR